MITVRIGDIFESDAQTLVNTVNCVGVMGKGIALEFKKRFPDMFDEYVRMCREERVQLGQPYLHTQLTPPWILNFPTKEHWRSVSRIEDIIEGLHYLRAHYKQWGITSMAVPPLGCGQGHLEWRIVGPTLYRHFADLDIPVELFAPAGTPAEELTAHFLGRTDVAPASSADQDTPCRLGPGWVALVEILHGIEREPYHWPVGRTTFQKLAYFATESGIPTGLRYQRGSYGPHASELKRQITQLVNNGLIREERLGRMFAIRTGPTLDDAREGYADHIREWRQTIEAVTDLFVRMNTQQAEVAATVHFASRELAKSCADKPSESEILRNVLDWKQNRKPSLDPGEVALAIRHLNMLGWIHAELSRDLPVTKEDVLHV